MISQSTPAPTTVVHPIALLAEPKLGTPVLAFLLNGQHLRPTKMVNGFLHVQLENGDEGFVPAAVCTPLATPPASIAPITHVLQAAVLFRCPTLDSQSVWHPDQWFIVPDEPLRVLKRSRHTLLVQRQDGQKGTIPIAICAAHPAESSTVRVSEPILLYRAPSPVDQFVWMLPSESLVILGQEDDFILIQRDSGQIGYVSAKVCGQAAVDTLAKVGPVDFGWLVLGVVWTLINWTGLTSIFALLQAVGILDVMLTPYLAFVIVLTAAVAFFCSRRRSAGRSFAAGLLLCYFFWHPL